MRKLVLFGLLAGIFGLALLLERAVSRPAQEPRPAREDRVVLELGGGPPRTIPESPPEEGAPSAVKRAGGPARPPDSIERPALREPTRGPPPAPLAAETARYHVVAKGETLSSIARSELGTSSKWKELASWNGVSDPAAMREGMRLRLSPPASGAAAPAARPPRDAAAATETRNHKVVKGDTLSRLAARYLGDAARWRDIQKLNQIADPANLAEGSTLRIPGR
jgi:nucleoid-associated protein YgaU